MSQKIIYEILAELGGRAKTRQIKNIAKDRYPDKTLWEYTSNRLRKLQRKGLVKQDFPFWVMADVNKPYFSKTKRVTNNFPNKGGVAQPTLVKKRKKEEYQEPSLVLTDSVAKRIQNRLKKGQEEYSRMNNEWAKGVVQALKIAGDIVETEMKKEKMSIRAV